MGKNRSLFQQFNYAINDAFEEGRDKHSDKKENGREMTEKLYSHSSVHDMKDFAKNLSNYMKENFPEVRQVGRIEEGHLQGFLNQKNEEGCSQNTLDKYKSDLNKLELIVNAKYQSCNWDYKHEIMTPTSIKQHDENRGADHAIPRELYNKILAYCKDNRSASGDAILCQDKLGVRVAELAELKVKNLDFDKEKINLDNTKGGKLQEKEMDPKIKEILEERAVGKAPEDKVFGIKDAAINRQLSRIQDKLGVEDKFSNHDIRRLLAQETYDKYREEGDTKQQAMDKTSQFLNHGNNRNALLEKSYIKIH